MTIGEVFDTVKELVSMTVSRPQLVAVVVTPAQSLRGADGVPATNKLLPLNNPKVAAGTGNVAVTAGGLCDISRTETLAVDPPHSGPQFMMNAVEPLLSNTPPTG